MTDRPSPVLDTPPPRSLYARLTTWFLPPGRRSTRQTFQLRFLLGANTLGLVVAVVSLIPAVLNREWAQVVLIAAFAAAVVAQAVLLRCGAPIAVMVWVEMATVGGFLTSVCLVTTGLEPVQLQWFLLLPLVALVLMDPERRSRGHLMPHRPVFFMTLVAIALGLGVIAAKTAGISFGVPSVPPEVLDTTVNHLTFMLAAGGLMYLYDRTMRDTVAELATLRRLLAVCAWCKLIRDERGEWVKLEHYMATHHTDLTHGICPSCMNECLNTPP